MAKHTFFIVNADPTGKTCIPRCHPHEAVFKKGQHTLRFKNLTGCEVNVSVPAGIYQGILLPVKPHDPKDESSHTEVPINGQNEGVYGCRMHPLVSVCPSCGYKLPADVRVVEQSGGSAEAGESDGDPVIIIDPAP